MRKIRVPDQYMVLVWMAAPISMAIHWAMELAKRLVVAKGSVVVKREAVANWLPSFQQPSQVT
jgi:hypothetical protein